MRILDVQVGAVEMASRVVLEERTEAVVVPLKADDAVNEQGTGGERTDPSDAQVDLALVAAGAVALRNVAAGPKPRRYTVRTAQTRYPCVRPHEPAVELRS